MTRSRRLPALTRRWNTVAARYLVLDAYLSALLQADSALGTDGPLRTVVRCAGGEALPGEGVDEDVFHLILAVHHEHPLGLFGESVHPAQQSVPVCVAGHAGELAQFSACTSMGSPNSLTVVAPSMRVRPSVPTA